MKTRRNAKQTTSTAIIFAIASLLLPSVALAQVKITEIMYDAPGSDDGHEWVEVANAGSQTVDIGKYKLFENSTNHGLKLIKGASTLPSNGTAIIAADAQKFLADYPSFSGALFDSAFSLSNEGETLVLKDASSAALDSVIYAASLQANGTGGTLNRTGEDFAAALASPGIYPSPMVPVPAAPAKEKASSTKKTSTASPSKNSAKTGLPAGGQGSAASPAASTQNFSNAASLSLMPEISESLLIGLGLVAAILLGVAGIFFIGAKREETSVSADEFTIE